MVKNMDINIQIYYDPTRYLVGPLGGVALAVSGGGSGGVRDRACPTRRGLAAGLLLLTGGRAGQSPVTASQR